MVTTESEKRQGEQGRDDRAVNRLALRRSVNASSVTSVQRQGEQDRDDRAVNDPTLPPSDAVQSGSGSRRDQDDETREPLVNVTLLCWLLVMQSG